MVRSHSFPRSIVVGGITVLLLAAGVPAHAVSVASFVGTDTTTHGDRCTIERTYGNAGYALPLAGFDERPVGGDDAAEPALPVLDETGGVFDAPGSYAVRSHVTSEDKRALETPDETQRRGTAHYGTSFDVTVDLGAAADVRVAAYLVDFDANARTQLTVSSAGSGSDSTTTSNYEQGVYEIFDVHTDDGPVTLHFEGTSPNAVVSGIFFDAIAPAAGVTYAGQDATSKGDWVGAYGAGGYALLGFGSPGGVQPWSASMDVLGNGLSSGDLTSTGGTFVWSDFYAQASVVNNAYAFSWSDWLPSVTGDPRAQQFFEFHPELSGPPSLGDRRATVWDGGNDLAINQDDPDRPLVVDVSLPPTAGSYRLALYFLDWDDDRIQDVTLTDVTNAVTLPTQTVAGFQGGVYYLYTVQGATDLEIVIERMQGLNGVLSGIFLDEVPAGPTGFAGTDETTGSAAERVCLYGNFAYVLANAKGNSEFPIGGSETSEPAVDSQDEVGGPGFGDEGYGGPYVSYSVHGPLDVPDERALLHPALDKRRATAAFGSQVVTQVTLPAGAYRLSVYSLDWDRNGRVQTTVVGIGSTNDSDTQTDLREGVYQRFLVTSNGVTPIMVTVNLDGGPNAVYSGLFVDPVGSAPLVDFEGVDTATKGNWRVPPGAGGDDGAGSPYGDAGYALVGYNHPFNQAVVGWNAAYDASGGVLAGNYSITNGSLWSWTPEYDATPIVQNAYAFAWTDWYDASGDPRGQRFFKFNPEIPGPPLLGDRRAATWDSGDEFRGDRPLVIDLDVPANSGGAFDGFRLALWMVDFDYVDARAQTIKLYDANTDALLDTQPVSSFSDGAYLIWNIEADCPLRIEVQNTAGINAIIGGIFLDELPA
ncbi:MAG TPA: hypothetical protein VGB83_04545 [Actinomycetota bacterium]